MKFEKSKYVSTFTFLLIIIFTISSCNNDLNDNDDKSVNCSFNLKLVVLDFYNYIDYYIISPSCSDKIFYCTDDITVKSLQESDTINYYYVQGRYDTADYFSKIIINFNFSAQLGEITTHRFVIEWNYNQIITTDTIDCEIEIDEMRKECLFKKGKASLLKMRINNIEAYVASGGGSYCWNYEPDVDMIKENPELRNSFYNENNSSRDGKEEGGIKYELWIADSNGREVDFLTEQTVKDHGFTVNFSITNNSEKVFNFGIHSLYMGYIYNFEHQYQDRVHYAQNIFYSKTHLLNKGETYTFSIYKKPYSEREWWERYLLRKGKYHSYLFGRLEVYPPGGATRNRIEIPTLMVNFEIK